MQTAAPFLTPNIETVPLPANFLGFDSRFVDADLLSEGYRRNLPHWRCKGGTYFVTFRLNDSLPQSVIEEMQEEKLRWQRIFAHHKTEAVGGIPSEVFLEYEESQKRTFLKAEGLLDFGLGSCLLKEEDTRDIVDDAVRYFDDERYYLFAWCVMPNHVHVALQPIDDWSLEDILGSWKKFSAAKINTKFGRSGQLWQTESFDRLVRDAAHYYKVVRYIAKNPASAGLLENEATVGLCRTILNANKEQAHD
jgi:putative transposase